MCNMIIQIMVHFRFSENQLVIPILRLKEGHFFSVSFDIPTNATYL